MKCKYFLFFSPVVTFPFQYLSKSVGTRNSPEEIIRVITKFSGTNQQCSNQFTSVYFINLSPGDVVTIYK